MSHEAAPSRPSSSPCSPPLARGRRLVRGAALLVVAALAGPSACLLNCLGSDAQNYCVETAKVWCQLQYRCCTAVERAQLFGSMNQQLGPYHDENGCVSTWTEQCQASQQAADESIAAGRTTFDGAKATECLNLRREQVNECDASALYDPTDHTCDDIMVGAVADGDACTTDSECAEVGSECQIDPPTDEGGTVTVSLEGTCKGQGDEGEACLPGGLCNGELRCRTDPTTFEQRCGPPGAAGATCDVDADCQAGLSCVYDDVVYDNVCRAPATEGQACDQTEDCAEGLACLQNASSQYVCTVYGAAGVSCSSVDDCLPGLLCAQDPSTYRYQCTAPSSSGGPCPMGDQQCAPGLQCRYDSASGDDLCLGGAAGEPCTVGSEGCQTGLSCRYHDTRGRYECQAPAALNAACDPYESACDAALRCIENASLQDVCLAPIAPDTACEINGDVDPCDGDHECRYDDVALEDRCLPRQAASQACVSTVECASGLYCDTAVTDTCVAVKVEGATCAVTGECALGLTCRANDAGTGTICRGRSSAGAACTSVLDCDAGLDCRLNDAGTGTVCRGASAAGERCEWTADCGSGLDCRTNDAQTQSVCRGLSAQGEGCEGLLDCAAGLECRYDSSTGRETCAGPAAAGELCVDDGDCTTGLVCRYDTADGRTECRGLAVVGESCALDVDCAAGLRCRDLAENGTLLCTDLLDDGELCADDDQCASGYCDGVCSDEPADVDYEICDGL